MLINRDKYLNLLIDNIGRRSIKVIVGLRRVGKSYLLRELFVNHLLNNGINRDQIIIIALDAETNSHLRNPIELGKHLRQVLPINKQTFLIIDEIQMCIPVDNPAFKGFKKEEKEEAKINFYSVLNDVLLSKPNVDIYVTGSNSKLLSTDVKTEFRGRGEQINVFPLSFKEFSDFKQSNDYLRVFDEYLKYGGMPYTLSFDKEEDKERYLSQIFEFIFLVDVKERNKIEFESQVKQLLEVLASTQGSLTNINKIVNTFKSKYKTNISWYAIDQYVMNLQNALLISKCKNYDIKGKELIESVNKFYVIDTGIRNACLEFSQIDFGFSMESIIYNELIRRGFIVYTGKYETFEKNDKNKTERKNLEVDFVAKKSNKTYYIQSCYQYSSGEKFEKEIKALLKIKDGYKKVMIEYNLPSPYYDQNGILHIGIIPFLLNEDSLDM